MEELDEKLGNLENIISGVYDQITAREEEEIHFELKEVIATLNMEIEIKDINRSVEEEARYHVDKLESFLKKVTINSRQEEGLKTRNNVYFLRSKELEELKSRGQWFISQNVEGESIDKDQNWSAKVDELCNEISEIIGKRGLTKTRDTIKRVADKLIDSRGINDNEIRAILDSKIGEIINEITEKEENKCGQSHNEKIFSELQSGLKSEAEVAQSYVEDTQASPDIGTRESLLGHVID